jgi:hypothetical protein
MYVKRAFDALKALIFQVDNLSLVLRERKVEY